MKKTLILITISLLFFSVKVNAENYYTNKNGLEFSKQQYENFIKAGFTEDYIENMEAKTYEAYSNMEFVKEDKKVEKYYRETIISYETETKIYIEEISKNDYDIEKESETILIPYVTTASHETTYKKLVVISSEINATVTPDRRLITSTLTWKKVPKVKSYDIFAGRVSGAEIVKNTEGGVMTSTQLKFDENCGVNGEQKFTQNFYVGSTAWNLGEGTLGYNGIGFTAELEEDSDVCNTDIGSIFSGATGYTAGLNFQTIKGSTVYISYQHATTNVSFSSVRRAYSFSNSGLGNVIYFSNSNLTNSYDAMQGVSLSI